MKKLFLILVVLFPLLYSCNNSELERLQSENDSLRSTSTQSGIKVDEYFAAFNSIQENLNQIKDKEKIISVQATGTGELTPAAQDQINSDILSIYELMLKNKQTIQRLNSKIKKAGLQSSEMDKTIKMLTAQLEEKDKEVNALKEKLSQMNLDMDKLNTQVAALTENLTKIEEQTEEQSEIISQQDAELNSAYYVYGTKSELRDNNIVTKDGMFKGLKIGDNFDKNYFTKVDVREVKSIKLNVKQARILSNHPAGSYELVQSGNKVESIEIKDVKRFWEMSKFLVIVTD